MPFTIHWRNLKPLIFAAVALIATGALSPSRAMAADIEFYSNNSYSGDVVGVNGNVPDLNNLGFSNRASSIRVRRGVWQICSDGNYRGNCLTVDHDVANLSSVGLNDSITSVRRGTGGTGQNPEINVYADTGYNGAHQSFNGAVPDLMRYGLDNRVSSLRLRGGSWEVCDARNFTGQCEIVNSDVANLGDYNMNNRMSSLRPARSAQSALPTGPWSRTCRTPFMRNNRLIAECKDSRGVWQQTQINTRNCTQAISNQNGTLICGTQSALPSGNWQKTCRSYDIKSKILSADCRDGSGRYRYSELDLRSCRQPISNQSGYLTCGEQSTLPSGSWQQSCRNAGIGGQMLSAECLDRSSRYRYSELDLRSCGDSVSNQNGYLACGEGQALPPGSWRQSCRNVDLGGMILNAECLDSSGRYRYSELDVRSCREPVSNQNGNLSCGEGQALPPGSWQQSCRDAGRDGAILSAECQDRSSRFRYSELDLRNCRQPVSNQDGYLTCGEYIAGSGGLPPGNWINSCRGYQMNGAILQTECRNQSGQWQFTVLDTRNCSQPVANFDGVLTCL